MIAQTNDCITMFSNILLKKIRIKYLQKMNKLTNKRVGLVVRVVDN